MSDDETQRRPRGTQDILPDEHYAWRYCLDAAERITEHYDFGRIATPMFEHTELFERGVGEETDIVQKEMYSFTTAGETRLTLRPEGTAPVARAYIENGMKAWPQPVKLWYWGSMFRHERPQAGRFREHHQFGLEILGDDDPVLDAQIIQVTTVFLQELGLENLVVLVNSIGCADCRPSYLEELKETLKAQKKRLCKDCRSRLETNPLRVLDCKEEKCQQVAQRVPQIVDNLCDECHEALTQVLEYLDALEIPYMLDPTLVRGLDYYTKTVFEVVVEEDHVLHAEEVVDEIDKEAKETTEAEETEEDEGGATDEEASGEEHEDGRTIALAGGGRYDDLVELLGGSETPAVGAAMGIERIIGELKRQDALPDEPLPPRVFVVQLGEEARKRILPFLEELREREITVAHSMSKGSIKSQLKIADKIGSDAALILGKKEAMEDEIIIRDMENGTQETVPMSRVVTELRKILRRKPRAEKLREQRSEEGEETEEDEEDAS